MSWLETDQTDGRRAIVSSTTFRRRESSLARQVVRNVYTSSHVATERARAKEDVHR